MNQSRSFVGIVSVAALALVPFLIAAQTEKAQSSMAKITGKTLVAADELKWVPLPGIEGAQQAMVWGDTAKGPHRAFFKFPAGLKSPMHSHTSGDRGVVVSGTLSLAVEGAPAKRLPPGSYFSIAGGIPHVTGVEGSEPCVFFIEREGAFDLVPADAKGAKDAPKDEKPKDDKGGKKN